MNKRSEVKSGKDTVPGVNVKSTEWCATNPKKTVRTLGANGSTNSIECSNKCDALQDSGIDERPVPSEMKINLAAATDERKERKICVILKIKQKRKKKQKRKIN